MTTQAGDYAEDMDATLQSALTPEKLEELAGTAVFSRGEKLIDMVNIQENSTHRVSGTVQGS